MFFFVKVRYDTVWGEELKLRLHDELLPMEYSSPGTWTAEFEGDGRYSFELWKDGRCIRKEWRGHDLRRVRCRKGQNRIVVRDRWKDVPENSPLYSDFFTEVVFRRKERTNGTASKHQEANLLFLADCPQVRPELVPAMSGSGPLFDDWKRFLPLEGSGVPQWEISLNADAPFEYKFLLLDRNSMRPFVWEEGRNRRIDGIPSGGSLLVMADTVPTFHLKAWRGSGTAVPVFSLRGKDDFGVGEFKDIRPLADWASSCGMNVLQFLPVNDTTLTRSKLDSYPYNAVSAFALHPQYISLSDAGVMLRKKDKATAAELDALPALDYERVNSEKERLLRKAYTSFRKSLDNPELRKDYDRFMNRNREWLLPYSVFSCIRDERGTSDFASWGEYAVYSRRKAKEYADAHEHETGFYFYEQFILDRQLKDARDYAHSKGICLKGDLPIGISRCSVDAWTHPELFRLDSQAGAPPDFFSVDGQNWGFPTYNWEKMAEDGFAWWKKRMRRLGEYFDCLRIDHILGFFRIWEIPRPFRSGLTGHFNPALPYSGQELEDKGFHIGEDTAFFVRKDAVKDENLRPDVLFLEDPRKSGFFHPAIAGKESTAYTKLDGGMKKVYDTLYEDFFYHRHERFWRDGAMRKLPQLLKSTGMLVCGEDLGMIPGCVPEVMKELRILSLEIQRMPKKYGEEFADPAQYPYLSVCATGTHDTSNLRSWWREDKDATRRYYNGFLHCDGDAPQDCGPLLCEKIIRKHLESPSMLCILPLQDWLSLDRGLRYPGNPDDERINVPAVPHFYWRYRMHLPLERLTADKDFSLLIREMNSDAGRG